MIIKNNYLKWKLKNQVWTNQQYFVVWITFKFLSGSEVDEKDKDNDNESDSDEDEEPDEELQKFIDTAAIEIDEDEADSIAKVHS